MATWRERLQPASFRGFPFKITATSTAFGRRVAPHEYPSRDLEDWGDDEGKRSRLFDLELYLVGPDHDLQANRLQDLLEEGTAGDLVHPFMGRHLVKPLEGRRIDNPSRETNLTTFQVTFVQFRDQLPGPTTDDPRALRNAAAGARDASKAGVAGGVVSEGVPDFVRGGTGTGITDVTSVLGALTFAQAAGDSVGSFARNVTALAGQVSSLVLAPANLAIAIHAATDSIRASALTPQDALGAYRIAFQVAATPIRGTSALALQAQRNRDLVIHAARVGTCYGAALCTTEATWSSADALAEAEAAVLDQLEELEADASTELYRALEELRTAFVQNLEATLSRVQNRRTVTLSRSRPSLVVAYSVYDGLEREPDVVLVSHARDPLFVPGGVPFTLTVDG